jgi:hypothetical protein
MSRTDAEPFLARVMKHLPGLSGGGFSFASWRFEGRPTKEGLGLKRGLDVDVDVLAARILDVEAYPGNVKYVESATITSRASDTSFVYLQKLKLPVLGGCQQSLHIEDLGERDGYRVIAWDQDDAGTNALDTRRGGVRTQYNLGAWLIRPTEVGFALSSAPTKKDVGSLKFAVMTKGADAAASVVVASNIDSMTGWARRG